MPAPNLITQQLMQSTLRQLLQIGINVPIGGAGMERWRKVSSHAATAINISYRVTEAQTLSIRPLWFTTLSSLEKHEAGGASSLV